jgi:methionyl aminopeptidase
VIRSLVGHGIGRDMHEDPQIPNFGDPGKGPTLETGMVLAIEPMVNAGGPDVRMGSDGWAVYSQDDSLTAHFEFTVAVTPDGPRILTPWHQG